MMLCGQNQYPWGSSFMATRGAEEDSHFREGDRHNRLAYDDDEEEAVGQVGSLLVYCKWVR